MRIANNNIFISKGETPTYSAVLLFDDGSPFRIDSAINNPYIMFVIRPDVFSESYVFKTFLDVSDTHTFDDMEVVIYSETTWDDLVPPTAGNEYKLHKKLESSVYTYAYFQYDDETLTTGEWIEYSFSISFTFPYASTSIMEVKTYKYWVTLFGGTLKVDPEVGEIPINPDYNYPIIEARDFVVGGGSGE